jgi:hypothetical protein
VSDVDFLVKLRDGATMIADACQERLEKLRPRSQTDTMADTEEIHWTTEIGGKGEYERSDDKDNPRHQALLKILSAHQGAVRSDNWFIWTFDDGVTIGRKRLG